MPGWISPRSRARQRYARVIQQQRQMLALYAQNHSQNAFQGETSDSESSITSGTTTPTASPGGLLFAANNTVLLFSPGRFTQSGAWCGICTSRQPFRTDTTTNNFHASRRRRVSL